MIFNFLRRNSKTEDSFDVNGVDLSSPAFINAPFSVYQRLRDHSGPVPLTSGGYVLSTHADVSHALSDRELGNTPSRFSRLHRRNSDRYMSANIATHILPFIEGHAHTQKRARVSSALSNVFKSSKQLIATTADECIAASRHRRELDVVKEIAAPFVQKSICRLFGISEDAIPQLEKWSESFFYLFAPVSDTARFADVEQDLTNFREFFRSHVQERRNDPGDDLISLLAIDDDGYALTDLEIADNCLLLFADGVENVQYGIANALVRLSAEIGAMDFVRSSPAAAKSAVTEALRLDSPAQIIPRVAQSDMSIAGIDITAGTPVFLALGSALRDPAVFDDPDAFHVDRPQAGNLIFGAGRHSCIGAQLALLQITTMVHALAEAGARVITHPTEVQYLPRFGHRWPARATIRI